MYTAMIAFLDDQLLNVTTELKSAGLWDNTVMVLMSDNGGYVKSFEGKNHLLFLPPSLSVCPQLFALN
jgi:arylsulfatase A-like enzyme